MTSKTHLKQLNFARVCKHPDTLDLYVGGHKSRIQTGLQAGFEHILEKKVSDRPPPLSKIRMFAGGRKEKFVNGPHPPDYED